ncbi:MAG TPA: DciA family protein [Pseudolabrys sp.]|nr:DciA family protein [Pseudolabrys sp.]
MNKPSRSFPRPLSELLRGTLNETFAKQGFASTELITRWTDIVGSEIAAHCEPMKIKWSRPQGDEPPEPATLMLRVEGPAALEIQHQLAVILERVNRFFGWQAVGRIALRQAPLSRRTPRQAPKPPDAEAVAAIAEKLPTVENAELRQALARLGASIKRK